MSIKTAKLTVDMLMLFAVVLSYVRWDGEPTFHGITGVACVLLFSIHCFLNRKAFMAYIKSVKKLKTSVRLRCLVDMSLIIVWSAAILSGVIALIQYIGIIETAFNIGRLHGMFARAGGVLIVIHIWGHRKQIISYFRKKRDR